jgi:hypothetical protein
VCRVGVEDGFRKLQRVRTWTSTGLELAWRPLHDLGWPHQRPIASLCPILDHVRVRCVSRAVTAHPLYKSTRTVQVSLLHPHAVPFEIKMQSASTHVCFSGCSATSKRIFTYVDVCSSSGLCNIKVHSSIYDVCRFSGFFLTSPKRKREVVHVCSFSALFATLKPNCAKDMTAALLLCSSPLFSIKREVSSVHNRPAFERCANL